MRSLCIASLCTALPVLASGQVAVTAGESLLLQPSVRCAGMADCTVAVVDDAGASSWNPGGLAFMRGDLSLVGTYSSILPGWHDERYWHTAGALRITPEFVVAASYTYFEYRPPVFVGPGGFGASGSYADERVPSLAGAVAIGEHLGIGLNVKRVRLDAGPASGG